MKEKIEKFFSTIAFGSLMCLIECILRFIWGYGDTLNLRIGWTAFILFLFSFIMAKPSKVTVCSEKKTFQKKLDEKLKEKQSHDICQCGCERRYHGKSSSINFTEGKCSICKCKNFIIKN